MPTYSYRCAQCAQTFDVQQSFTDANLSECIHCGGAVRKLFSPIGVTFNGSGFYRTDSRAQESSRSSEGKAAVSPEKTTATTSQIGKDSSSGGAGVTESSSTSTKVSNATKSTTSHTQAPKNSNAPVKPA